MKIKNVEQIKEFLEVVDKCQSDVYLTSVYGDRFNLKSELSRYVAIGKLLGDHGDELELFCSKKEDEYLFIAFFSIHKDMVA